MKENWVCKDPEEWYNMTGLPAAALDFDDWGYSDTHLITIGDEVEALERRLSNDLDDGHYYGGVVVGIIRNHYGLPVCYKVAYREDADAPAEFDYVPAGDVTMTEPCDGALPALEAVGYKPVLDDDGILLYFYNDDLEDTLVW